MDGIEAMRAESSVIALLACQEAEKPKLGPLLYLVCVCNVLSHSMKKDEPCQQMSYFGFRPPASRPRKINFYLVFSLEHSSIMTINKQANKNHVQNPPLLSRGQSQPLPGGEKYICDSIGKSSTSKILRPCHSEPRDQQAPALRHEDRRAE